MRLPHHELSRRPPARTLALATAAALAAALILGISLSFAGSRRSSVAVMKPSWLVLSSTRDGSSGEYDPSGGLRTYSMRPDGSRLTRLLAKGRKLDPLRVSANGSTIAYGDDEYAPETIYVSRADGTGLRRVAHFGPDQPVEQVVLSPDGSQIALTTRNNDDERPTVFVVDADGQNQRDLGRAADPDWSPDGSKLVLATGRGCVVFREPFDDPGVHIRGRCRVPKWSPDGREFVFETRGGCGVARPPESSGWVDRLNDALQAGPVLIRGMCSSPTWSPDGRWIAFETTRGLWVTRPNGEDPRRVGPPHDVTEVPYSWSPDSRRLALGGLVMTVTGRTVRLGSGASSESAPIWTANGKRLALVRQAGDDPAQVWIARADGSGLKRLTSAGVNELVGLARQAPARAPAAPLQWSERVLGPATLETRKPIGLISADGGRVAYTAGSTPTDCEHISIWTPDRKSIRRVWQRVRAPCQDEVFGYGDTLFELALSRWFIGWSVVGLCGNSGCGSEFRTAALPKANPKDAADDDGTDYGNESHAYFGPVGHGNIFATDCTGLINDCPGIRIVLPDGKVRRCNPKLNGYASVSDRWIAAYRGGNVVVLNDRCAIIMTLHLAEVTNVSLDGDRLVVVRSGELETYDVPSGALEVRRAMPVGYRLEDVGGGIALLRQGTSIRLLRLNDGRSFMLDGGRGHISAEIEQAGLYYSHTTITGRGRLEFVPRSELERRLR